MIGVSPQESGSDIVFADRRWFRPEGYIDYKTHGMWQTRSPTARTSTREWSGGWTRE